MDLSAYFTLIFKRKTTTITFLLIINKAAFIEYVTFVCFYYKS